MQRKSNEQIKGEYNETYYKFEISMLCFGNHFINPIVDRKANCQ